jgi:tetratricopeptide (TPR) repeat protein/DNA-binding CsgD family transcriptional regulator
MFRIRQKLSVLVLRENYNEHCIVNRRQPNKQQKLQEAFNELHDLLMNRQPVELKEISKYHELARKTKNKYFIYSFTYLQGIMLFMQAKYHEALRVFRESIDGFDEGSLMHSRLLYWTGRALYINGDLVEAIKQLQLALFGFNHLKDEWWSVKTRNLMGLIFLNMGFYDESLRLLDECTPFYTENNMHRDLSVLLGDIGNIYRQLGRYDEGEKCFLQAGEIIQQQPEEFDKNFLGNYYKHFGDLYLPGKKINKALEQYNKCLELGPAALHPFLEASFYLSYSSCLALAGDIEQSIRYADLCFKKAVGIHAGKLIEGALRNLGQAYLDSNKLAKAEKFLKEAMKEAKATGSDLWLSETHVQLYLLYKKKGVLEKALNHLEESQKLKDTLAAQEIDLRINAIKGLSEITRKQQELLLTRSELAMKKQELDLAAMYLKQKNALLDELRHFVNELRKENAQKQRVFKAIHDKLQEASISITENDTFKEKINDANRRFVKVLRRKYATITNTEAEVAALLRKGMNTKEISNLLVIDRRAVEQHRYRLRKKLGLKRTDDLALILSDITE